MPRFALKVYYDGRGFAGSQRQPGERTVEGELLTAFDKMGLIHRDFQGAGRTDKGVSALGNVFTITTPDTPIPSAINSNLPREIVVLASEEVHEDFKPRKEALERSYRYFLASLDLDVDLVKEAAAIFVGTHSFHNYSKTDGERTTIRTIKKIDIKERDGFLVITITGESFVWQQVRRMVQALKEVGLGEVSRSDIERSLELYVHDKFRPAPADGLILLEVRYDFEFTDEMYSRNRLLKVLRERKMDIDLTGALTDEAIKHMEW